MVKRFVTKGKGKGRKVIPMDNSKKSVRSVSLEKSAIRKVNKEQGVLLNKGESANFSKALNSVIMRAKREGIPVYDTRVNINDKKKAYHMWVTDMKKHKQVKGSDTIVLSDSYGQAVDDFITVWNKENRMKMPIGYPVVQGTSDKKFRYKRDHGIPQKLSGLNKVTIMEFTKNGKQYDPRLFQVNVNGKGAYFPANKELAIEQAEGMIESAKYYDKIGKKVNQ